MTATSNDAAVDLRGRAHPRVSPNYRILDARTLFNVTTLTENRIDNFNARLDCAVVGDNRQLVDVRVGGRIEIESQAGEGTQVTVFLPMVGEKMADRTV